MAFKVFKGNTKGSADVEEFVELINYPPAELDGFFAHDSDIYVARAPGRLDVMGGIADYSGSLVLELPIAEATIAAVQWSSDAAIRIVSLQPDSGKILKFEMKPERSCRGRKLSLLRKGEESCLSRTR